MTILKVILYVAFIYLLLIIFSQLAINQMAFYPPLPSYQDNKAIIKIKTADGSIISAIYLPNSAATYTILYSHGNAEDLGSLIPHLEEFKKHGFAVMAYDYHGYGTSQGKPSEKNIYKDINAAYDYLTQKLAVSPQHIIVYGASIGTASTLELASQRNVAGVILQSPFVSAFRVMTHWGILPFDYFVNFKKIGKVTVPILIIHGEEDDIIPLWHSVKLLKYVNAPVSVYFVKNAGHNDLLYVAGATYWITIANFVKVINNHQK